MLLHHGTEPPEGSSHEMLWILKRMALIQTSLTGPAQHWFSFLTQDVKRNWEEFCKQFIKNFESGISKNYAQMELGNVVRLPKETISVDMVPIVRHGNPSVGMVTHRSAWCPLVGMVTYRSAW